MAANPDAEEEEREPPALREFAQSVRSEPLVFWDVRALSEARCLCCTKHPSHVSVYPFHNSAAFARQVVLWCATCGFGMVPVTSFPLDAYYESAYASENRRDRELSPERYFELITQPDPPPGLKRYAGRAADQLRRARKHIPRIDRMLDVGAGPGYALLLSEAQDKVAIELDRHSRKYLDHIGARVIDWEGIEAESYDLVLMSHVLEHFLPEDVRPRLERLHRGLRAGGLLYIEVPPGGLSWKHYDYKHEPHTLFFTPEALFRLVSSLDMDVRFCAPVNATYDRILEREHAIYTPDPDDDFGDPRGRLTAICRKR